ncbi:hypothetical protein F4677DRAFT_413664 [Hypoxylon crocopeplum]|nr:hypothetical protein F4677DRAFT_413664 [Hypoxylon crocopeplum]
MAPSTILETPDWDVSISSVPVKLSPQASVCDADKPTAKDMGEGDPDSIIYVNLKAKNIPDKFKSRIKQLENMLDLTHQWLDTNAGIQAKNMLKKGKLPSDSSDESSWKRSDYRVKVVDSVLKNSCAWIYSPNQERVSKRINVKKATFHLELLKDMLSGLALPTGINKKLEKAFEGLSKVIVKTEKTAENRAVWTLFHVFTYDEHRDDFTASLRNVSYRLSQEMKDILVHKSRYERIDVDFAYTRADFKYNENTWVKIEPDITKYIEEIAAKQVRNPIEDEIPVD